jgi:hypothetical protein
MGTEDVRMQLAAGANVDRYVVEGLLGRGGMAVVYRVRHRQLGSVHALKLLLLQTPGVQERLLLEGRAQSGFRHANVVAVTDVVDVRGVPALVLELIDGPTLDVFLAQVRPTLDQADQLARGILKGVAAAHRHGLVHRDLKPGNVLLALEDGELVPKVTDFGLAKVVAAGDAPQQTHTGATLGTPAYMAPEQVRDARSVDARADVFALGAILYELVCGKRAFDGADTLDVMNAVVEGRFTPPRELAPDLPPRMEQAILRALALDRDQRLPDAEALLEVWRGDSPSSAPHAVWDRAVIDRAGSLRSSPALPSAGGDSPRGTWSDSNATLGADLVEEPVPAASAAPAIPWRAMAAAAVLGALGGIPFLIGDLGLLFGDVRQAFVNGGPLAAVMVGMAALGLGALFAFGVAERVGHSHAVPWLLIPAVVTALGHLGTRLSIAAVQQRAVDLDAARRPIMAAAGTAEALVDLVAGSAAGACLFLVSAVIVAAANQPARRDAIPARAVATGVIAPLGGMVVWAAHPWLSGQLGLGLTDPFPVYVTLAIGALAVCSLATDAPAPHLFRPRALVIACAAFAVAHAARSVDGRHLMTAAAAFAHGEHVPGDVTAAERFVASVGAITPVPGLVWAAVLVLAALPVLADTVPKPFPWKPFAASALALALIAPIKLSADRAVGDLAAMILPGELRAAGRYLVGAELYDADGDIVVGEVAPGSALQPGDRVVAVDDRSFAAAAPLLHALADCACDSSVPCPLSDSCIAPGAPVGVTVLRAEDGGPPRKLDTSVPMRP